ncbi:MAG: hypothetical protein SGJ18_07175 [Pseudomonadota bacterium]|nr:hypothetical protein [Pseudomonadota bacterium]
MVLLLTGHFIGKWASWISFVAILISIQAEFSSTLGLAFLIAAKRLPASLAAYRSGILSQTISPKKLILIAFSLILFFLSCLLFFNPLDKSFILFCTIAYIGVSFAEGLYRPALAQLTSQIFKNQISRLSVNTNLNLLGMLGVVAATSASGILMSYLSVHSIILFSGLSAAVSLACFSKIYCVDSTPEVLKGIVIEDHQPSLLYAPSQRRLLLRYGLLALLYSFIGIVATKFPFEVYHRGIPGVGITNFVLGVGIICGGLLYKFLIEKMLVKNSSRPIDGKIVLMIATFFLGFTLADDFTFGMMFLFAFILCFTLLKIHLENRLILLAENRSGVVFSQLSIFEEALISIASISFGLIAIDYSLKDVGVFLALVIFTFCISTYLFRILFHLVKGSQTVRLYLKAKA